MKYKKILSDLGQLFLLLLMLFCVIMAIVSAMKDQDRDSILFFIATELFYLFYLDWKFTEKR